MLPMATASFWESALTVALPEENNALSRIVIKSCDWLSCVSSCVDNPFF